MNLQQTRKGGYLAFELDSQSRQKLLSLFEPKFPDVIAHHVTLAFGVNDFDEATIGEQVLIKVVGYAEDESLEALVVEVDGRATRPDGKIFHITWSLDRSKGRKPAQSNELIKNAGYKPVDPVTVTGTLQYFAR